MGLPSYIRTKMYNWYVLCLQVTKKPRFFDNEEQYENALGFLKVEIFLIPKLAFVYSERVYDYNGNNTDTFIFQREIWVAQCNNMFKTIICNWETFIGASFPAKSSEMQNCCSKADSFEKCTSTDLFSSD